MGTTQRLLLGIALCLVWAGCDERDSTPFIVRAPVGSDRLLGLWTGHAEITSVEDALRPTGTGTVQGGFAFPVALELRPDRLFTLRSFGYPIVGASAGDKRFCSGVFALQGSRIEFFPDDACPALPLHRFTIGGWFPDGLELEAATRPALPGQVFGEAASVRVRFRLERN
ncbi:MAG TPA: hypothetical protein VF192_11055 [Longimicrobiales bacterium]